MTLLARPPKHLPRERTIARTGYPQPRWDFGGTEPTEFYDNSRPPFAEAIDDLDTLIRLPEGWNGYDAAAPNPDAIEQARSWIRQMYEDGKAVGGSRREPRVAAWHNPHVTADEYGDVVFEWWNEDKALTVYVSRGEARYIKGWGLNIETDMENGEATSSATRRKLWAWLTK